MNRIFLFASIAVVSLACKTTKNNIIKDGSSETVNACTPIVLDSVGTYKESDDFLLIGAEIQGKCIEIEVEYSGGCGGDEWTLSWTGNIMKSLPPKCQINLHLKDEDHCREVVRKKLKFDISSVYNKGEITFLLKNFRGELRYTP